MGSPLSGATVEMKIGNQIFNASTLTERDYDEIDEYIQSVVIEVARRSTKDLPQVERLELLQAAVKAAASTGWSSPEGLKIINSQEGTFRLGYQLVKKNHSRLKWEEFLAACNQDVNESRLEIDLVFGRLHENQVVDKGEPQEGSSDSSKSDA